MHLLALLLKKLFLFFLKRRKIGQGEWTAPIIGLSLFNWHFLLERLFSLQVLVKDLLIIVGIPNHSIECLNNPYQKISSVSISSLNGTDLNSICVFFFFRSLCSFSLGYCCQTLDNVNVLNLENLPIEEVVFYHNWYTNC